MYINKHQIILKNTKKDNNLKHKNKLYQPLRILKRQEKIMHKNSKNIYIYIYVCVWGGGRGRERERERERELSIEWERELKKRQNKCR